jgi:hypothetical protein
MLADWLRSSLEEQNAGESERRKESLRTRPLRCTIRDPGLY